MYYPEQRPISEMIRIQRRTLLPEYAIGTVEAELGSIVDVRDTVARGLVPARHVIIDATHELGVRADEVEDLLLVNTRRIVSANTAIAGKDAERGRRVLAPFQGLIVTVDNGRIIFQASPQMIDLKAGVRGQVVQVIEGRGVAIEATGGVIQGVWGNDKTVIAPLNFEPLSGLDEMEEDDIGTSYRGTIVITKSQLNQRKIRIAEAQQMAGILAPSMDASLEKIALNSRIAIMIATGFGDNRFTRDAMQILEAYEGYSGVLDAAYPTRFDNRRAELMINQFTRDEVPSAPLTPLRVGMMVRITRLPWAGRVGEIVEVPREHITLENGLRVHGVWIEIGVDRIAVPLANIEVAGT
ncbi:MAG: hypothetical protein AAFV93_06425 [Chloroflexota bacterium]